MARNRLLLSGRPDVTHWRLHRLARNRRSCRGWLARGRRGCKGCRLLPTRCCDGSWCRCTRRGYGRGQSTALACSAGALRTRAQRERSTRISVHSCDEERSTFGRSTRTVVGQWGPRAGEGRDATHASCYECFRFGTRVCANRSMRSAIESPGHSCLCCTTTCNRKHGHSS